MKKRLWPRCGVASLVCLSLFAAACGDDDDDSTSTESSQVSASSEPSAGPTSTGASGDSSTTSAAPTDVDPDGILKFGVPLISGAGVHFDPIMLFTGPPPNVPWTELIYGTLLREADDGTLQPWMAQDVEVVDPQTVRISLRPGVTFSDGAKYDAEAVKAGLLRTRNQFFDERTKRMVESTVGFRELESIDVVDPLTLVVHLNGPVASLFLSKIATIYGMIVSPKQVAENPAEIETNPVGAGPFLFEKFEVDQVIELRKNPDFWDAENWRLGGVQYLHTPRGPTQTNGLLAGAIDLNIGLPVGDMQAVKARDEFSTKVQTLTANTLLTCSAKPPFDSAAVRKAVQIGIDRDEYNELIYGGLAEPAYGAFRQDHPAFDPKIKEELAYDPDEAKRILAEADVSNVTFDLATIPTQNYGRNIEVIQAQLARIGITVNVTPYDDIYTNWVEPQKPGLLIAPMGGQQASGSFAWFAIQSEPGAAGAYCGYSNTVLMDYLREAAKLTPTDPKVIDLYRKANREYVDAAVDIPLVFEPLIVVWNEEKVGGTPTFIEGDAFRPRLEELYIKK